ncbi:MAG: hypothetical protein KDJ16_10840 [Hyphomicrobiales bacterium]|nr:hypothetical protein [Hyphomicrobiales bacterium]
MLLPFELLPQSHPTANGKPFFRTGAGPLLFAACALVGTAQMAVAQDTLLQPGEAYVTRFSGTTEGVDAAGNPATVIDTAGIVGSIIDLRNPGMPPQGQHWIDEPQRKFLTAGDVGQVFGVALDGEGPPNVYLTATAAFGLHRTSDNGDWMAGQWGPGAGPGTIYKLDRENGYLPAPFAEITLDGRANSGAALGNIAYDRYNRQLFVSDMETGMIHRLDLAGNDLGRYDHGVDGRPGFDDVPNGIAGLLVPVAFDPATAARIDDCPDGNFANTPSCWNLADFRRRVWGLGVHRGDDGVRLYYTIWGSEGFGNPEFADAPEDERRNAVWSVALNADGSFDVSDVRREFFMPDFHNDEEGVARAGFSRPVSDIAFPQCADSGVMLTAERGGMRNLGLDAEAPFATPHESRAFRYERDDRDIWRIVGRYDIGFYDRSAEGIPYMRANSAGGLDFGYGYTGEWTIDRDQPAAFAWMSGDTLCSPAGMCFFPPTGTFEDDSEVHGIQGQAADAYAEIAPEAAFSEYPVDGSATPATGPDQSYMIDTDLNFDSDGNLIVEELTRNDATKIGDLEIYTTCEGHDRDASHRRTGSDVHTQIISHYRQGSNVHTRTMTHRRYGSEPHTRRASHLRDGSTPPPHLTRPSHLRYGSEPHLKRPSHLRDGSTPPPHTNAASHLKYGTNPPHTNAASHKKYGTNPPHTNAASHLK